MDKLGILVGGGPAPGINGVISAVTVRACQRGLSVIGIKDGYKHLVKEKVDQVTPLDADAVYRIHLRGGSVLGTSRENPTKSEDRMRAVIGVARKELAGKSVAEWMETLRGPVQLPPRKRRR